MKCVIVSNETGVAVVYPAPNARLIRGALIDGKSKSFKPAVPFYSVQGVAGSLADFDAAVTALKPQWSETEAQFYERYRSKAGAGATVVDVSALPADRTFRAAWTFAGGKVAVDMPKAREIWRDKMRAARAPLLAALDVAVQRADEAGDVDAKAAAVAKKQQLRDVTSAPEIEAAPTPEDLMKVWPEVLN